MRFTHSWMVIRTRLLVLLPLCAESFSEVSEGGIDLFICADQGLLRASWLTPTAVVQGPLRGTHILHEARTAP